MLGDGSGVPAVLIALVILTVVVTFVMRQTVFGRRLQATAYNPVSTRLAGVNSPRSPPPPTSSPRSAPPSAASWSPDYLGRATSVWVTPTCCCRWQWWRWAEHPCRSRGNFLGTLGGALLLSLLTTLLTTFHLSEGMKVVIQGAVILLAVIASKFRSKRD